MTKKELLEMLEFVDDDKQVIVLNHILEIDELTVPLSNELNRCETSLQALQAAPAE